MNLHSTFNQAQQAALPRCSYLNHGRQQQARRLAVRQPQLTRQKLLRANTGPNTGCRSVGRLAHREIPLACVADGCSNLQATNCCQAASSNPSVEGEAPAELVKIVKAFQMVSPAVIRPPVVAVHWSGSFKSNDRGLPSGAGSKGQIPTAHVLCQEAATHGKGASYRGEQSQRLCVASTYFDACCMLSLTSLIKP